MLRQGIAVNVRYHNILRKVVGKTEETVVLPVGASLRDVLEHVGDRHGPCLRHMLFAPEGDVASYLVVFRNRKLVPHDQAHAPLADGDELMFFPAISGG
jgi:molybdopterin converting factor small subunit